jgi:hypothetical protein
MNEKRKRGRPAGRSITNALKLVSPAVEKVKDLDFAIDKMPEKHKRMFESLLAGDDELITALKSDYTSWFTGITKMVTLVDGTRFLTSKVSLDNVSLLDEQSYERLRSICASQVRRISGIENYLDYVKPVREFAKNYAPMAFGQIVNLSKNSKKDEMKYKASNKILELAGERPPEATRGEVTIPVQLNILLTQNDGNIVKYQNGNTDS